MSVREILRRKDGQVITISPDMDAGAAARMLIRHGIGGLPVVESNGTILGFLAERDLVRVLDAHPGSIRDLAVREVMTRPAPTCAVDEPLHDVMARMTRKRLRHLIVLDGRTIAGVISVGDLVKFRLEQLETETGVLRDIVAAQRAGYRPSGPGA
jgi:CBS domain-containing protein